MKRDAEQLIMLLSPEIDRKCAELRQARREKTWQRIFTALCAAAVVIPTLLVFWEVNLAVIVLPVLFTAAAFLMLSPIIFSQQGGYVNEPV